MLLYKYKVIVWNILYVFIVLIKIVNGDEIDCKIFKNLEILLINLVKDVF